MRKLILVALFSAAAVATAAPAAADDETFVSALDMIGVPTDDPAAAVAMGRSVCSSLDAGESVPVIADRLSVDHGLSFEQAGMVAGFSIAEYCDHHKGALEGGTPVTLQ